MKAAILTVIAACVAGGCAVVPPRPVVYVGPPVVAVAPPVVAVPPPPAVVIAPAPVVVPRPYYGFGPYWRRGWY